MAAIRAAFHIFPRSFFGGAPEFPLLPSVPDCVRQFARFHRRSNNERDIRWIPDIPTKNHGISRRGRRGGGGGGEGAGGREYEVSPRDDVSRISSTIPILAERSPLYHGREFLFFFLSTLEVTEVKVNLHRDVRDESTMPIVDGGWPITAEIIIGRACRSRPFGRTRGPRQ